MSLFFNTDSNGSLTDPLYDADLASSMLNGAVTGSIAGFSGVDEVYLGVHGWNTNFDLFCQRWNQFASNLSDHIPPSQTRLSIALHWPSTLTEENFFPAIDLATFWQMERRADRVGQKGLASLVRSIVRHQRRPIRLVLIGHSFGCKVICAALQQLAIEQFDFDQVQIVVVLLQAAFENDALEPGKAYGDVARLPVRIWASRSDYDAALNHWFPMAAAIGDPLAAIEGKDRKALGGAGPTDITRTGWGKRLSVDDLTGYHGLNRKNFSGPAGSHDDVLTSTVTGYVASYIYGFTPTAAAAVSVSNPPALRLAA